MSKKILCIIDANLNRAREGIRVIEDLVRFYTCEKKLCAELKEIRHSISKAANLIAPLSELAKARAYSIDVGKEAYTKSEGLREGLGNIISANTIRVAEALRVLEEFSKLYNPKAGKKFKEIRMKIYVIEQQLLHKISKERLMENFKGAELYAIIDSRFSFGKSYESLAKAAIKGGAKIIQLRDKVLSTKKLIGIGIKIKELCAKKSVLFIVNDRVDIALAIDADGVHLGQEDMPTKTARKILGPEKIIGYSTHSLQQAKAVDASVVDYISVGPIFATQSKPQYKAVGLKFIKKVRKAVKLPFVAIGGIKPENAKDVIRSGAGRVAVITAISEAKNPVAATKGLLRKIRETKKKRKNK